MTTPALPPGFVLETQPSATPPLPPGFQTMPAQDGAAAKQPEAPNPAEDFQTTLQIATPWNTYDTGIELPESISLGLAGAGKSFADTGRGVRQIAAKFTDSTADDSSIQREIDQSRARDESLMDTGAGITGNVLGYGAQMLAPAGALRGTMVARAALPTTLGGNVVQGAVVGAAQPVATGESRAGNAAVGGAFGAGGHGLSRGLGALARNARSAIPDEVRAIYEAAKERGIELSPVQLSDSRFLKRLQGMIGSLPFTGTARRQEARVGQFNESLAGTIGEKAGRVDSAVYSRAKNRQSAQFDDLTSRNSMRVDDKLIRSLTNIAESAKMAGEQVENQVESAIEGLYRQAVTGPDGVTIPGRAYQAFDSLLGNIAKAGGPTAHFLGNVQSVVRRAMDDSISPADAAAWRQLRKEYGNRKTIAPLVAKSSDGDISPTTLMGAVTNSRSAKEAMASGTRGELGELAKIGQRMKPPQSSGTAENLLAGGVLNPVNWPAYAAGVGLGAPVGAALDSQALVKLIMRRNPGMTRQAAAEAAQRLAIPASNTYSNQRSLTLDIVGGTPGPAISESRLSELRAR